MNIYENVKEKGIENIKTVSISSTRDSAWKINYLNVDSFEDYPIKWLIKI